MQRTSVPSQIPLIEKLVLLTFIDDVTFIAQLTEGGAKCCVV